MKSLGIYDQPFRRMNWRDDFPKCWTHDAVLAKLLEIVSRKDTFHNPNLVRIASAIAENITDSRDDFLKYGIEMDVTGIPFKNILFCMLNLADRARYGFDDPRRHSSVLIWKIALSQKDWNAWQWEDKTMSPEETADVEAILTLNQRIADIKHETPIPNYNRNGDGAGPGDGGGGGPGAVAKLNVRSVGASLPRALAPMRAMLSRL